MMSSSIASSEGSHYTFKALTHVPRRLFRPPTPTVGAVRSFRLTPCFQVTLEDVINAKHLPPLGRKEFEEYLLFKEYSIENLYFWLWFEDYRKSYFQWQRSGSSSDPSPALALSYSRAKETFFTHARPYELNLTERTVQDLKNPLRPHNGPRQHPHPDAFAAVKYEIDGYLTDSLRRFTANFSGNAGRNRGLFAVFLGTITIACGCLIIIFSVLSAPHRPLLLHLPYISRNARLASIPVLWLGFLTLLAGLQGVCILIFLFGDVRQLHAYELAKPKISPPINPRPHSHPPAVRLGGGRVSSDFGEEKLSNQRSPSLVLGKRGEIDMDYDDDRNSVIFKSGVFAATESATSLDQPHQLQDGHRPTPNENPNSHARPRISVDITQHKRDGSGDMLEITFARTLEEDMYRIDDAPLSDTTIAVESKYYAAAAAAAASAATTATTADYFQQLPPGAGAGACAGTDVVEPYRFDFDALPLPAGMALPPWQETLRSVQPRRGGGVGVMGAERKIFAPLTNVLSPLITRTQWIIIVRSALIGLVLACAVGGASMAIH